MDNLIKPSLVICYLFGSPWVLYQSYLRSESLDKAVIAAAIGPGVLWIFAWIIMFFGWMMWDLATGATGQDRNPSLGRFIISLFVAIALAFFFSGGDGTCIVNVRAGQC